MKRNSNLIVFCLLSVLFLFGCDYSDSKNAKTKQTNTDNNKSIVYADDSPYNGNIQTAINACSSMGGGSVILKKHNYGVDYNIIIPSDVSLIGSGVDSTIISPSKQLDYPVIIILAGLYGSVQDLAVCNNSCNTDIVNPTVGISIENGYNQIINCQTRGFTQGIRGYKPSSVTGFIDGCKIIGGYSFSNKYGIYIYGDFMNLSILNWYSIGENGIYITKQDNNHQCEGLNITSCKILSNSSASEHNTGIEIHSGLEFQIENNTIDQVYDNGILLVGDYPVAYMKIIGNWIGGRPQPSGSITEYTSGIGIFSKKQQVNNVTIIGNTLASCTYYGVRVEYISQACTQISLSNNRFLENVEGDVLINKATFVQIDNNSFTNTHFSLREVDNNSTCIVSENYFSIKPIVSTSSHYLNNWIGLIFYPLGVN
jgi:hypothetical protein